MTVREAMAALTKALDAAADRYDELMAKNHRVEAEGHTLRENLLNQNERVAYLEKCVTDLQDRVAVVLGERDALVLQNTQLTERLGEHAKQAKVYPQHSGVVPEGKAIYYGTGGSVRFDSISWMAAFDRREPVPTESETRYGRKWRRLMWRRDPAHSFYVLAVYVEEPE